MTGNYLPLTNQWDIAHYPIFKIFDNLYDTAKPSDMKLRSDMYSDDKYKFHKAWVRILIRLICLCLLFVFSNGCGNKEGGSGENAGSIALTAWAHHGKPEEWQAIRKIVEEFNRSQKRIRINLIEIAEGNYDTQVQSAAVSGELPDILEFDGPMLANYVWKGYLKPLDQTMPDSILSRLLPSIREQGTYRGHLYAVGIFDSGLALFANFSLLREVNARIPGGIGDAWTIREFNDLLSRLAVKSRSKGRQGYALDIKRDYRGEWWTYGFYPALVSGGAGLIVYNRKEGRALGVIICPQRVCLIRKPR